VRKKNNEENWTLCEVRAILSNGPGGPGPRAPNLQGAPEQPKWYFFLRNNVSNCGISTDRIEYRRKLILFSACNIKNDAWARSLTRKPS